MLRYLRAIGARLFHRAAVDADMEDELHSHVQHRADDLERSGLDRAEAERRARVELGGGLKTREAIHEAVGGTWLDALAQDVRFGLRMLRKAPSFTAVAVITLALTIGANAVVFAALNAIILRPLNVPRAESLYSVHRTSNESSSQSYPDYLDLRDRNRSFEALIAYNIVAAGLDTGGDPSRVWLLAVSGNYFDALGIRPRLGRVFHASDEHGPDSAPFIVLSYAYWHRRFHDDPAVVGRVVRVNKHPFTIVGVAPRGFFGTLLIFAPDFFTPITNQAQLEGVSVLDARANHWIFMVMGHLKAGVTRAQAAADFNSISASLERTYPKEHGHATYVLARPGLYGEYLGGPLRAFLTALMLLAGLILLAACANLGSLFAARAADRSRELALRLALGAGRARVLRQLFTETVLVSLLGGAVGLAGSIVLLRSLATWQPFPQFPLNVPVTPDASVYGVALLLAVASGLLFGAVPVRQVLRTDPYAIIKWGPTGAVGRRLSLRDVLLAAQIAICALLVTASLVAVQGLVRSLHGHFGVEPRDAMVATTDLSMGGYREDARPAMQRRMIDAMTAIPGVSAVGLVDWVPLATGGGSAAMVFRDETTDLKPGNAVDSPFLLSISPDYFRAAGTALVAGRNIDWHDDEHAPQVAVVNQEFARKVFGAVGSPVGRTFKNRDGTRIQVVGVVENGKYESLTEEQEGAVFRPVLQSQTNAISLIVRSSRDPQQLATELRNKLRTLDPGLPCFIQSWTEGTNLVLFPSRVAAVALGILGAMAALLSLTGIFGLATYAVSKRLRELGIRIALGADRREVLQATLSRPFRLLALGSAAGLILGLLASKVLAVIVFQASPRDPLVLVGVILVMFLLGLLATWLPARRALSIDPLSLLREE